MVKSADRAFLAVQEMVGLLDSDEEDDYLRDAGLDDRSDDELGFQEKEVDNGLDSEGEEEQETELQSNTNRLILFRHTYE